MICAIRWASAAVYDVLIVKMTTRWYASVLKDLGKNSTLLDVGIGTATALRNNKSIVDAKDLRVAGIDYDARYIKAAERRVAKDAKLRDRVSVVCASVYDGQVLAALRPKGGFDAAYFSGSLTLMPDPVEAAAGRGRRRPAGRAHLRDADVPEAGRADHARGQAFVEVRDDGRFREAHVVRGGGAHLPRVRAGTRRARAASPARWTRCSRTAFRTVLRVPK